MANPRPVPSPSFVYCYSHANVINLRVQSPPFAKGGSGGDFIQLLEIPLNPPFLKGDFQWPYLLS